MTDRDLLVELLAIKLYEHHCAEANIPAIWPLIDPEDRQHVRNMIIDAEKADDMYPKEDA